jgi:hypothetical protein
VCKKKTTQKNTRQGSASSYVFCKLLVDKKRTNALVSSCALQLEWRLSYLEHIFACYDANTFTHQRLSTAIFAKVLNLCYRMLKKEASDYKINKFVAYILHFILNI